ncbi:hypothetical protein [Paenibacillus sedimenti]|uniref:Uncharacterized protein n=1 Tax=Paenibacillus sedimenti TaxID=2770274 RepID=A0A926KL90_9BACL|nr:hypothetical protein [Paenibacillus sedimenti]MBD0379725.1 hypothetical protein [Paenibacillus sedimenti]
MAKLTILYDFHEEGLRPFVMSIRFGPGELDWSKSVLYVPLSAPFQKLQAEEIDETEAGISVLLEDLTVNPQRPHCFGISLNTIKHRHTALASNIKCIGQLWVRMNDIEDIMQMDMRAFFSWNFTNTK